MADPAFDAAPPSRKPTGDATRALAPAATATWKFSPLPGTRAEAVATKPAIAAQLAFIQARREDRNYEAAHPYLWAAYGVTGR